MDERYAQQRAEIESIFREASEAPSSVEMFTSPSGQFLLRVSEYETGRHTGNCSRGIVTRLADDVVIADIKRNYSHFWHAWAMHPNGNEYLLCGEDYQGYTCVNLTRAQSHVYFPEDGYNGCGFCWVAAFPSPDGRMLAVDGCYWACPYEIVFFDFRTPDQLPYPELLRVGDIDTVQGWQDASSFRIVERHHVRTSDGVPYADLTNDEKAIARQERDYLQIRETQRVIMLPAPEATNAATLSSVEPDSSALPV